MPQVRWWSYKLSKICKNRTPSLLNLSFPWRSWRLDQILPITKLRWFYGLKYSCFSGSNESAKDDKKPATAEQNANDDKHYHAKHWKFMFESATTSMAVCAFASRMVYFPSLIARYGGGQIREFLKEGWKSQQMIFSWERSYCSFYRVEKKKREGRYDYMIISERGN